MMNQNPRVRHVEAFPVDIEGKHLIYLRDPDGLATGMAVPGAAYFLMTQMDGSRSATDLQNALSREFRGSLVTVDEVSQFIGQLDDGFWLHNTRSQTQRKNNESAFRRALTRPAAHAGLSYPEDQWQLRDMIDGFFDKGPGRPSGQKEERVKALIAPHIDFNRGGSCFAWAYKALAEAPPPDLFVVLGTGHSARQLFGMSRKDFETPFGLLRADREVIDHLSAGMSFDVFADELAHKDEHAIEFQAVFLKYLYPDKDIPFVPILCGSFHEMVEGKMAPQTVPEVAEFVGRLRTTLDECGKRVCFIAGVDLSHVGQRFGDIAPLTSDFVADVESVDLALIEKARSIDADAYFDVVVKEGDRTRVCGTSSIYTMLQTVSANRAELLKYDHIVDHETQQMVSFASMVFY